MPTRRPGVLTFTALLLVVGGVRKRRAAGRTAEGLVVDRSCRALDFKVWDYPETHAVGVKIVASSNQSREGQSFDLAKTQTDAGDTVFRGTSPAAFFCAGDKYVLVKQALSTSEQVDHPDPRCPELTFDLQTCIVPEEYQFQSQLIPTSADLREKAVVYQLHIPTFTKDSSNTEFGQAGTFESAISKLDYLRDLGVNVIEMLPINAYPFPEGDHWKHGGVGGARNWGYGPASFFALDAARKGGEASFKRFVDEAMKRGILVGIDVVINHSGCVQSGQNEATVEPAGAYKCPIWHRDFWDSENPTWWGPRPDYNQPQVVEYFMDHLRYWRDEYRIRYFRWDATTQMRNVPKPDGIEWPVDPAGVKFLQDANTFFRGPGAAPADEYAVSVAEDAWGGEGPWPGRVAEPAPEGLNFDAYWDVEFTHKTADEMGKARLIDFDMDWVVQQCTSSKNHVMFSESHDLASNQQLGRIPNYMRKRLGEQGVTDPFLELKKSALMLDLTLTCPGIPMLFQNQEYYTFADFAFDPPPFIDDSMDSWRNDGSWNQHSAFQSKVAEMMALRSVSKPDTVLQGLLWGTAVPLKQQNLGYPCLLQDCKVLEMYRTSKFDAASDTDHVLVVMNFGDNSSGNMEAYEVDFHTGSDARMDDAYITAALDGQWTVKYNGDAFPSHNQDAQGAFGYNGGCTDARFQTVTVEKGKTTVCVPRMSTIVFARARSESAPRPAWQTWGLAILAIFVVAGCAFAFVRNRNAGQASSAA